LPSTTAGNIGRPVTDLAMSNERYQWLSLEVSSFQLHDSPNFAPDVGVLTNLAPDHLDRYRSVDDYAAAKARVFESQGEAQVAVLNADDPLVARIRTRARRLLFSRFAVKIEGTRLHAKAWGEPIDAERHKPAVEVKGATYTTLRVARHGEGWVAQTVVDV